MRIPFLHRGHAERCLKDCRRILEAELHLGADQRLPARRLRNAFCQGLGYGSYDELIRSLSLHPVATPGAESGALPTALTKSFTLGLDVARASGFRLPKNGAHLAAHLADKALRCLDSTAPRPGEERRAPPSVRLYRSTIEGREFLAGFAVDGPYVSDGEDGVAIGVSSLVRLVAPSHFPRLTNWNPQWTLPERWVVVKYSHEIRIDLSYLSDRGRLEFSRQFGVPISEHPEGIDDHGALFFRSSAFIALCDWTRAHPRLAKRIDARCSSYVPTLPSEIARANSQVS